MQSLLTLQTSAAAYTAAMAGAGGLQLQAVARGDDRDAIGVSLYRSPPYALEVPPLPVARLSINLTASRVVGGLVGDRALPYVARCHSLFLTPAGAASQWRKSSPSRHLNLYFHPQGFGEVACAPLWNATLPAVSALATAMADELDRGDLFAAEAVDSLARLLLIHVARRAPMPRNPLAPALMSRLDEYVTAHLGARLLARDLAAVVSLSPNRFTQALVQCTGLTPHRYVMQARLMRAQALLQDSAMPLAQVALACGFASQQHMTQHFRRQFGVTPGRLRQQRRSS